MKTFFNLKAAAIGALSILGHTAGAAWTIQTVDGTANTGFGVSLALAPSTEAPGISYYRWYGPSFPNFFYPYYATPSGSSWLQEQVDGSTQTPGETTSLVFTEQGTPAIAYRYFSTTIRYSIRTGGAWSASPLNLSNNNNGGAFYSLVWQGTEAAPSPVAAFYDATGGDLEYAYLNAGSFVNSELDTNNAGTSCSMAQSGSSMAIAYIRGGKLAVFQSVSSGMTWGAAIPAFPTTIDASYCALALAPATKANSNPNRICRHIVYFHAGSYKYITDNTDDELWSAPETIPLPAALQTLTYYGLSIAVGTDNIVRVALFDYGNRQLVYAQRSTAGVWSAPEVVDSNPGGISCSLRLNAQNQPRIAYGALVFDSGSSSYVPNGLKYASFSNALPATPLSFAVTGKAKRSTTVSKLTIKGTASASAIAVQWKVGKKSLKKVSVVNGRWSAKVGPLLVGKNKVKFRALGAGGAATAFQTVTVTRK